MKRKGLLITGMVAGLAIASCFTSMAGEWSFDGPESWKWHYQNDDGGYTTNNWQQIDGKWYHFDNTGYLDISQWIDGYYVDAEGVMATSGEWEGGIIMPDGSLHIDEIGIDSTTGKLIYERNTYFVPKPTIGEPVPSSYGIDGLVFGVSEWKRQFITKWSDTLKQDYGTYTLDYQLPADWQTVCPQPIMTDNIDYMCFQSWGGWGYTNWSTAWQVGEDSIIHITATYYPID